MEKLALPLLFLLLGAGLKRIRFVPERTSGWLSWFVIYISLPAITLLYIHQLKLSPDIIIPAGTAWVVYLAAAVLFIIAARFFNWSKATTGALILCCGLGNTSFVGFPVVEALYGKEALKIAVLVDQPGSFLVLSTLGIITAGYFAGQQVNFTGLIKKIILFPAFPVFIISLALAMLEVRLPDSANRLLGLLGMTITPFALTSIGMQLAISRKDLQPLPLSLGLGFKLIMAPALIYALFSLFSKTEGTLPAVSILESAMGPMISSSIVAIQYNLNPRLVSQIAGIGIPLSFITLLAWYTLI